ncbi:hypothetical protein [Arcobacter roscoffensis]|uniref:Uncharacterized protein n=1 Tax=Arcobacter roscoffensis TaxID=2961520 RepID=A0ABY5E7H9_9BACT|nr:hypothetical protein [Arcobacter roscoffensis]UTJ06668.1 hypothetical protein NJU99_00835 [Arcobacter roscoffensis]
MKKLFIIFFTIVSLNASTYMDTITFLKVKRLVEKEEQIAKAYKDYVFYNAKGSSQLNLIDKNYLPSGFNPFNLFNVGINVDTSSHMINTRIPKDIKDKTNLYDYYYSNINRKYTRAPISYENDDVKIILDANEKYKIKYKDDITTSDTAPTNKYYLDSQGVLHWYDNNSEYKFSITEDKLLVDSSVGQPGSKAYENFFEKLGKEVLYAGQETLSLGSTTVGEYVNLGEEIGYVKIGQEDSDVGKAVIQFTRRAGGMLVNGDIYTWGNNANKITGIDAQNYYNSTGIKVDTETSNRFPVVNTLVRMKAKNYEDDLINDKRYYSSPKRPYFVDFFSTVYHSTCGVTNKGELYCGGKEAKYKESIYTNIDSSNEGEKLYRGLYFDGSSNKKANKIFANNAIWLILANATKDSEGNLENGQIYRWGEDYAGFAGSSSTTYWKYLNQGSPTELVVYDNGAKEYFKDITYTLTIGYRKIAALSNQGELYTWGVGEYGNNNNSTCYQNLNNGSTYVGVNLCMPNKIAAPVAFKKIKGGLQSIIALGENNQYYKIYQNWGYTPTVTAINSIISSYSNYDSNDDAELLDVDISSKLVSGSLQENSGVVWINSKNELKGDYFTVSNANDDFFKASIAKIKWKKIKVIEDDNGMCGIDIYNQMYCWGIISYFRNENGYLANNAGNTFMLPIFNTNLYDLNKDYMLTEGGYNGYLTNMTSNDWSTTNSDGKTGAFFMKYPTYIGGFNYEFEFK